eukprot:m.134196 g.134196  ORF g.134196 m.134196 type:complete len:56 (-) comp15971_c0_seq9:136-303(-)
MVYVHHHALPSIGCQQHKDQASSSPAVLYTQRNPLSTFAIVLATFLYLISLQLGV